MTDVTHSAPRDGQDTVKTVQTFGTNVLVLSQQRGRHVVSYVIWAMPI